MRKKFNVYIEDEAYENITHNEAKDIVGALVVNSVIDGHDVHITHKERDIFVEVI